MLTFILAAADHAAGNPVSQIATQFGVDGPRLLAQTVAFLVVALCLRKFAYEPVLKMLDERQTKIAEDVENSEKIRRELVQAENKRKEVLAKANDQALLIIKQAQETADALAQKKALETQRELEQMLAKGRESLRNDQVRMEAELRREMIRLIADATQRVTGKILTPEDHKRLNEETVSQISRN